MAHPTYASRSSRPTPVPTPPARPARRARPRVRTPLLMRLLLALCLTLPSWAGAGPDEAAPEKDEAVTLDPVVVVGDTLPEERRRENPSKFVTIVNVADSTERMETVSEVLSETVAVQVNNYGDLGDFATVSIRGSSAAQVQVYLDGVPMNRAYSGVTNLADLPLDSIEYIEIYRGFTPADFPAAGIGGAINLVTRKATKPEGALAASHGAFDTYKVTAVGATPAGPANVLLVASYAESRGDFEYNNDNGTPAVTRDDFTAKRINNQFDSLDLTGRVQLDHDDWRFSLLGVGQFKDQGLPGIGAVQATQTSLGTERYLACAVARNPALADGALDLTLAADYLKDYQTYDDPLGEIGLGGARKNENRMNSIGGRIKTVWRPEGDRLVALGYLEYREETFQAVDYLPSQFEGKLQKRASLSAVAQAEVYDKSGAFAAQGTLRYERYDNRIEGEPYFAWSAAAGDNHEVADYVSPSLGLRYRASPAWTLQGNVGRFYRVPTFNELFGDRGVTLGNTGLRPEVGTNYDLGFIVAGDPIGPFHRVYFQYAFFQSWVDDLIVFFQNSQRTVRAVNIGAAVISGQEVALNLGLTEALNLSVAYAFQAPVDKGEVPHWRDNQLPMRNMHQAFVKLDYQPLPGLKLWTDYLYLSGNYLDRANVFELDDRNLWSAGVTIGLYKRGDKTALLTLEGKNLLNNRIADVAGYPLPGTSYYATLKIGWR